MFLLLPWFALCTACTGGTNLAGGELDTWTPGDDASTTDEAAGDTRGDVRWDAGDACPPGVADGVPCTIAEPSCVLPTPVCTACAGSAYVWTNERCYCGAAGTWRCETPDVDCFGPGDYCDPECTRPPGTCGDDAGLPDAADSESGTDADTLEEGATDARPDDGGRDAPDGCTVLCFDCCIQLENGDLMTAGSCGCFTEEYMHAMCNPPLVPYTCDSAEFLAPGTVAISYPHDLCGPMLGLNSYWYEGPITVPPPPTFDPCPSDDPCCHAVTYPVGFVAVDPETGANRFVPLDTSELPIGVAWGCAGTNCGVSCWPEPGTTVRVHVRLDPDTYPPSSTGRFVVEEVCGP